MHQEERVAAWSIRCCDVLDVHHAQFEFNGRLSPCEDELDADRDVHLCTDNRTTDSSTYGRDECRTPGAAHAERVAVRSERGRV